VKPGDFPVHLLLQWDVVNWPRIHAIDVVRLVADARPARLAGREARVPSPEDLLLYLCLQADRHGHGNLASVGELDALELVFGEWWDNRLIRFTDVAEAIRRFRGAIDWRRVVDRALAGGVEGSAYASLYWVTALYGPPIAPGVLEALGRPRPRRLRRRLFAALAREPGATFRRWWVRRSKRSQLRVVKLLDLLELVFPTRRELARHRRLRPGPAVGAAYLRHVAASLLPCVLGSLPWLYGLARQGTSTTSTQPEPARE
jgi:hypothetical protein